MFRVPLSLAAAAMVMGLATGQAKEPDVPSCNEDAMIVFDASGSSERPAMALRKFIIERNIPKVGSFDAKQLSDAAAKSNEALCQIGARDI